MALPVSTSRFPVGSSARMIAGELSTARAITMRCCSPPETGKSIVELLHNICSSGSSVVMTTHNLQLLKEYPGRVYRCANHQIVDVTDEYMPRQRTIEIDLNIDN